MCAFLSEKNGTVHANITIIFFCDFDQICTQYIRSMQTSSKEKEKAVAVIEQFVVKKCCDIIDRRYVMEGLLSIEKMLKPGIGTKLFSHMSYRSFTFIEIISIFSQF